MATTFDDLMPDIRITASGLFEEKVYAYLRDTMVDFSVKTGCLLANAEIELDRGEWEAELFIDSSSIEIPFKTLWVKDGNRKLVESSVMIGSFGVPASYMDLRTKLVFDRAPDQSMTFTAACMVKPKGTAVRFNDVFNNDYREAIIHGASMRICLTQGGSWFNPDMAQYHKQQYDDALRQTKAEVLMRHHKFVQPVRFI
jgi:hypothetical protein